MTDLAKTVLGGAWGLAIGWILPVFLSLQLITLLLLPELGSIAVVGDFEANSWASQQLALLSIGIVVGLAAAAAQAPLYRVLEGYLFWPARVADRRVAAHRVRRSQLAQASVTSQAGVRSGLRFEAADRYPVREDQFAPTALGNAIRRFETYAADRYQMDSQLLWHHLTTVAPERAVKGVETARTNVDFFVTLVYGGVVTGILGSLVSVWGGVSGRAALAMVLGFGVAAASYWLAVLATDEWAASVRALVDLGRNGVARTFGFEVPDDFTEERTSWRVVNTLVRRPYEYSQEKEVAEKLTALRRSSEVAATEAQQST